MYYNNKRLMLSIFWIIVGVVMVTLTFAGKLDSSLFSGMGGAFIGVGALQVARNVRYRKDPQYSEKIDTLAGDERIKYIRGLSWAWAGYIVVIVESIASVAALIMGQHTVQMVLCYSVCLTLCAYWISYLILSRKY